MILNTGTKNYQVVQEVLTGECNDVYVCREQNSLISAYKTIWMVKSHPLAKKLLGSMEYTDQTIYEECFVCNGHICFVFPYVPERPIVKFYSSCIRSGCSRQQIWRNLVVQCMTLGLPDVVLHLMLRQNQIQVGADGSVQLSYFLDLSEYDATACERDNTILCAGKIAELAELEDKGSDNMTIKLLRHKLGRQEYKEFIQLYQDIRLTDRTDTDKKKKITDVTPAQQDRIYRFLCCLGMLLVGLVLFHLLGSMVLEDFSLERMFTGSLHKIGTESLVQ